MNTGAPFPSVEVAQGRILHFQRKLHVWASNDAERRFRDLWNLVEPLDVLMESRMRWKSHVRFGGRRRGDHRPIRPARRLAIDPTCAGPDRGPTGPPEFVQARRLDCRPFASATGANAEAASQAAVEFVRL